MVEITEHGNNKFKAECYRCNCRFTYELEDIEGTKIKCPDCGYVMDHYPSDWVRNSKIGDNNA